MTMDFTAADAREVIEAAKRYANEAEIAVAVVVVDRGGHLIAAERMDGAPFVAPALAEEKAFTAVAFGAPTRAWHEVSQPGQPYWGLTSAMGGKLSVLAGGMPIKRGGALVAAVGVSGGTDEDDHACAEQAAQVIAVSGDQGTTDDGLGNSA